jgi:hypothetical protein
LSKDFESSYEISVHQEVDDYKLFKVRFFDSKRVNQANNRPLPMTEGELVMESTIANTPSVNDSWIGSWTGIGFFPENYVVRVPLPFFSELDVTFYKDQNGDLAVKWFYYYEPLESWALNNDVYIESNLSEKLTVRFDYHSYHFNRVGGLYLRFDFF